MINEKRVPRQGEDCTHKSNPRSPGTSSFNFVSNIHRLRFSSVFFPYLWKKDCFLAGRPAATAWNATIIYKIVRHRFRSRIARFVSPFAFIAGQTLQSILSRNANQLRRTTTLVVSRSLKIHASLYRLETPYRSIRANKNERKQRTERIASVPCDDRRVTISIGTGVGAERRGAARNARAHGVRARYQRQA